MFSANKRLSPPWAGLMALATAIPLVGAGAMPAYGIGPQAASAPHATAEQFAGTWHWMFEGRSFSTMILVSNGSGLTGTVTPSRIALDDHGGLLRADPGENPRPQPISSAKLQGAALHVTVRGGFQFTMTLKDDTNAEIHPAGAPPSMKPIPAEKVH